MLIYYILLNVSIKVRITNNPGIQDFSDVAKLSIANIRPKAKF